MPSSSPPAGIQQSVLVLKLQRASESPGKLLKDTYALLLPPKIDSLDLACTSGIHVSVVILKSGILILISGKEVLQPGLVFIDSFFLFILVLKRLMLIWHLVKKIT